MDSKSIYKLVSGYLCQDMRENGKKISDVTIAAVESEAVVGYSKDSLEAVRQWFNEKDFSDMSEKSKNKYLRLAALLLTLVATKDIDDFIGTVKWFDL